MYIIIINNTCIFEEKKTDIDKTETETVSVKKVKKIFFSIKCRAYFEENYMFLFCRSEL